MQTKVAPRKAFNIRLNRTGSDFVFPWGEAKKIILSTSVVPMHNLEPMAPPSAHGIAVWVSACIA